MKRILAWAAPVSMIVVFVCAAVAQPPQPPGSDERAQPPSRGRFSSRHGDRNRPDGPPPFQWRLGCVIPQNIRDALDLSEDQDRKLDDLEREVKDRVLKALSDEQKKTLRRMQMRGPGGLPPRDQGPDGPPDRPEPPDERP